MAPRSRDKGDFDWHAEWRAEQTEVEQELLASPPPKVEHYDWRDIPSNFLRHEPAEGKDRLFVLQTCRWREDWDEGACWSPEDGRALLAFLDFARAEQVAKAQQTTLNRRLGIVEVALQGMPSGPVFLVKRNHPRRSSSRPRGRLKGSTRDAEGAGEGQIVAAFADRSDADQDAQAHEQSEWRCVCDHPNYFSLQWTSLPAALLGDLFLDLGVRPPPAAAGLSALRAWWKETAPLLNDWQRKLLYQVLDRFSDYQVVSVPLAK